MSCHPQDIIHCNIPYGGENYTHKSDLVKSRYCSTMMTKDSQCFGSQQCGGEREGQFVRIDNAARHIDHYLWVL